MRTEVIVESRDAVLALEPREADALNALGQRLAARGGGWWDDDEDEEARTRSVIRARPLADGRWTVRVSDAVGLVAIDGLQLLVRPKIPLDHLLYLFARSGRFPRLEQQAGRLATSDSLWELVAEWFVTAFERLLRRDLVRDYEEATDDLRTARGRIEPERTTGLFYSGRLELGCRYDEFAFDTPLNRVLLAATRTIVRSPSLRTPLRRRARRLEDHLADVGELRSGDLLVGTDRRSGHYAGAIALARSLLGSAGRTIMAGEASAWTFLIRTPEMVEAGILAVIAERLGPRAVRKGRLPLPGAGLTLNPDLVFGATDAVGDVKYKLADGAWVRSDLYQVVAFAAAYRVTDALLVRFRTTDTPGATDVPLGDFLVHEVTWPASAEIPPADAADALGDDVVAWLSGRGLARPKERVA
jgi:hypothetical protein